MAEISKHCCVKAMRDLFKNGSVKARMDCEAGPLTKQGPEGGPVGVMGFSCSGASGELSGVVVRDLESRMVCRGRWWVLSSRKVGI